MQSASVDDVVELMKLIQYWDSGALAGIALCCLEVIAQRGDMPAIQGQAGDLKRKLGLRAPPVLPSAQA